MTFELAGIGVSGGIAIGKALVLEPHALEVPEYFVAPEAVDAEVERLRRALQATREDLFAVRDAIPADAPQDTRLFIDAHLLMLDDPTLREKPAKAIREERLNAAWAVGRQRDHLVEVFERMEDPYLRAKREDVIQVADRVLRHLLGHQGQRAGTGDEGQIIVADDLSPADTVLMKRDRVLAFVTDFGGPTSHTAIIARSLGLPAIVGTHSGTLLLRNDDTLIVDGDRGTILINPDAAMLREYGNLRKVRQRRRKLLEELKDLPAETRDGVPVRLLANIELPDDVDLVQRFGAAGVGLYRTEFLFMNRTDIPGEEEQLAAFGQVLAALPGKSVTIRSLDLGADKSLRVDGMDEGSASPNPALGLRAVRLCLRTPELFRPHLRAILRASALGPVQLMIPLLTGMSELRRVQRLIEELKEELRTEGLPFDPAMPIGAMVEVPAVAMAADYFAPHLDFFSIGTNDLIQYALAIDRGDDDVNYLYDPLHPGVLHLVRHTIEAAARNRIPVAMCGEMAGNPDYTRLLLGLGLRDFSMYPGAVPEVKETIRNTSIAEAEAYARDVLAGGS